MEFLMIISRRMEEKVVAFVACVEKEGSFIGGFLSTDEELSPLEFIYTEEIKPLSKLDKILYGASYEMKWFGDLIAGTLYRRN